MCSSMLEEYIQYDTIYIKFKIYHAKTHTYVIKKKEKQHKDFRFQLE